MDIFNSRSSHPVIKRRYDESRLIRDIGPFPKDLDPAPGIPPTVLCYMGCLASQPGRVSSNSCFGSFWVWKPSIRAAVAAALARDSVLDGLDPKPLSSTTLTGGDLHPKIGRA